MKQLKGLPVEIVGINWDGDAEETQKRCLEEGVTWRSFDSSTDELRDQLYVAAIPQFYLIDQNGIVRAEMIGGVSTIKGKLIPIVETLLKEMGHDVSLLTDQERKEAKAEEDLRNETNDSLLRELALRLIRRQPVDDQYLASLTPAKKDVDEQRRFLSALKKKAIQGAVLLAHEDAASLIESHVDSCLDPTNLSDCAGLVYAVSQAQTLDDNTMEQANRAAEKALELAPDDSDVIDTAARFAHVHQNDLEKAILLQKRAIATAKKNEQDEETVKKLQSYLDELKEESNK